MAAILKLSEKKVEEIYQYAKITSVAEAVRRFQVSRSTVRRIVSGEFQAARNYDTHGKPKSKALEKSKERSARKDNMPFDPMSEKEHCPTCGHQVCMPCYYCHVSLYKRIGKQMKKRVLAKQQHDDEIERLSVKRPPLIDFKITEEFFNPTVVLKPGGE